MDALDLIVFQRQYEDGTRRVQSVHEIPSPTDAHNSERVVTRPLWEWKQTGVDDATGKFTGEYIRLNEISDDLKQKRRLGHFKPFTMDDVMRMSELPGKAVS
jgi:hypothetical protein